MTDNSLREAYKASHSADMCPNCTCIHNGPRILCSSCKCISAKPIMISQDQLDQHRAAAKMKTGRRRPLGVF